MTDYPEEITAAVLLKNAHLSDNEVERDLRDTEAEIKAYDLLADGLNAVANLTGVPDGEARMNRFRASGYQDRNRDRRAFVAFLNRLTDARRVPA